MPDPAFDLLLPLADTADHGPIRIPPEAGETTLRSLYAYPPTGPQQWTLRANMVATIDGGAWGADHRSGSINDDADFRVFKVLRSLADVVIIGAGTARAEGYTELSRPPGLDPDGRPLELAVVTRTGELPATLATATRPPFVLTGREGAQRAGEHLPADHILTLDEGESPHHRLDLRAGLRALTALGLSRMLCEGGPTLLADLLTQQLVDELCVTTTPVLVGPGPGRIVAGSTPNTGPGAAGWSSGSLELGHLLYSGGTTAARWGVPLGWRP